MSPGVQVQHEQLEPRSSSPAWASTPYGHPISEKKKEKAERIIFKAATICCLQETHFACKDTQGHKVKGNVNGKQKWVRLAILEQNRL